MPLSPPAVTIDDAITFTAQDVQFMHETVGRVLRTQLDLWIRTMFVIFNDSIENERLVQNWNVPTTRVFGDTPIASTQLDADNVTGVVWRTLNAAKGNSGLYTPAQNAAVIAAFNTSWAT